MDTIERTVQATSNEGLLTAYAALTHKMHAAETVSSWEPASRQRMAREFRDQRALVQTEILRRMEASA